MFQRNENEIIDHWNRMSGDGLLYALRFAHERRNFFSTEDAHGMAARAWSLGTRISYFTRLHTAKFYFIFLIGKRDWIIYLKKNSQHCEFSPWSTFANSLKLRLQSVQHTPALARTNKNMEVALMAVLICIAIFEAKMLSKEIKYASSSMFSHNEEWEMVSK